MERSIEVFKDAVAAVDEALKSAGHQHTVEGQARVKLALELTQIEMVYEVAKMKPAPSAGE